MSRQTVLYIKLSIIIKDLSFVVDFHFIYSIIRQDMRTIHQNGLEVQHNCTQQKNEKKFKIIIGVAFVWGWGGIKRSQPFHEISSLHKKLIAQFSKLVVLNLIFQIKVRFFNWFEFHLRNYQSVFFFKTFIFGVQAVAAAVPVGEAPKNAEALP